MCIKIEKDTGRVIVKGYHLGVVIKEGNDLHPDLTYCFLCGKTVAGIEHFEKEH